MERIRLWAFPIGLIVAWMMAAAYTLSLLIQDPKVNSPEQGPPQAVLPADEPV